MVVRSSISERDLTSTACNVEITVSRNNNSIIVIRKIVYFFSVYSLWKYKISGVVEAESYGVQYMPLFSTLNNLQYYVSSTTSTNKTGIVSPKFIRKKSYIDI